MYDDTYSRAGLTRYVDAYGLDALLAALVARYPHRELYAVSTDWHRYPGQISVLKCRGVKGDLLVRLTEKG